MSLLGLNERDYTYIWNAPEGNDYATQFRRQNEKDWYFSDYALSKQTAIDWLVTHTQDQALSVEYRIVRLSRYPPCSVVQVIMYKGFPK